MEHRRTGDSEFRVDGFKVPIYYEDTDFSGYVFHPNYLKYFDRAREEIIGISLLRELFASGLHFVVKSASQEFVRPARHGDTLYVSTGVRYSQSPLLRFRHDAFLDENCSQQSRVCTAAIELVSVNASGRPVRLPVVLQDMFSQTYTLSQL